MLFFYKNYFYILPFLFMFFNNNILFAAPIFEDVESKIPQLEKELSEIRDEIISIEKLMAKEERVRNHNKRQSEKFLAVVEKHIDMLATCKSLEIKFQAINNAKEQFTKQQSYMMKKCAQYVEKDVATFDAAEKFLINLEENANRLKQLAETKAASTEALDKSRGNIEAKIRFWKKYKATN